MSNVIADAPSRNYPPGNLYPSSSEFRRQFMSYENGDYRLVPSSPWRGAGNDGLDLGAGGPVTTRPSPVRGPRTREP